MTVSLLVGAIRTLAETTGSPAEILAGLNRRLVGRGSGFTTCLTIRLSPSGALILANAGHLAPYRNGEELSSPPALPLGLDPKAAFTEQSFQLVRGVHLTLVTDGVPEATNRGELFGFERTSSISTSPAPSLPTPLSVSGKQMTSPFLLSSLVIDVSSSRRGISQQFHISDAGAIW